LAEERNERWVLFALAALAVAYVIYWYRDSIHISFGRLGKYAGTVSYAAAPLFAVFAQTIQRRRRRGLRAKLEQTRVGEGVLREERDVAVKLGGRWGGGAFRADVSLTRAALYVIDRSARKDPMRFPFGRVLPKEQEIVDADFLPDVGGEPAFLVRVKGATTSSSILIATAQAETWWIDIRRRVGKSTDRWSQVRQGDNEGAGAA
jgi:hypothetical protein